MARTRIIIDTDPGQDDAVAILLALAERDALDLLGITTVAGNVPLPLTTSNALRILELARRDDVPVFPGASQPLLRKLRDRGVRVRRRRPRRRGPAAAAHRRRRAARGDVPDRYAAAAAERSVTLCPLGPLTNIALAFAQEPALASKVERIVLMGGARDLGNVTPAAEFNFFVDPHAAAIVLRLDVPIVMFGLHATHQAIGTSERVGRIAALGTPVAHAIRGMLSRRGRAASTASACRVIRCTTRASSRTCCGRTSSQAAIAMSRSKRRARPRSAAPRSTGGDRRSRSRTPT